MFFCSSKNETGGLFQMVFSVNINRANLGCFPSNILDTLETKRIAIQHQGLARVIA